MKKIFKFKVICIVLTLCVALHCFAVYAFAEDGTDFPAQYKTPLLTSVKNQGMQGLCWAFSATGTLEAYLLNHNMGEHDFSEEHMNWWATDDGTGAGWTGRKSGEGGWAEIPMGYLISWNGPVNESDIPYQNGFGSRPSNLNDYSPNYGVTGIKIIPNDISVIKKAIMEYSAVSTNYNSYSKYYNANKTAYYSPKIDDPQDGHAICVVGWDDNYQKEYFGSYSSGQYAQPKNNGAWLCKNSWGVDSGYSGYLWISYEDAYIFNEEFGTTFAVTDVQEIDTETSLYQVEKYGATYKYPVKEDHGYTLQEATFADVFTFDSDHDLIDKVIFYSDSVGSDYKIYYIPFDTSGEITMNKMMWTQLSQGRVRYTGYICDDIKDYHINSQKGAIGIYMKAQSGKTVTIGVDEWMTQASTDKMYFNPNAQRGVSYVIGNGEKNDILDLYKRNGDDIGGMISIKLVAKKDHTPHTDSDNPGDTDSGSDSDITILTDTETFITDFDSNTDLTTDTEKETDTTDTSTDISTDNLMLGDVNFDGYVNMLDAVTIQKYIAKLITFDNKQLFVSDVDRTKQTDLSDVVLIQKYVAKLIDKF
ncbi:MAG: hypothetical protein K6F76_03930 [Clostridiales bacterium]|nr:hypothetical protein [Clostridiales bacterium]